MTAPPPEFGDRVLFWMDSTQSVSLFAGSLIPVAIVIIIPFAVREKKGKNDRPPNRPAQRPGLIALSVLGLRCSQAAEL